jgi:molecular chaperone DnaJ
VRDLYEILGIGRNATDDDIKRAYRRRARELHPDTGGDQEAFKELTAAYEVLRNPTTRENYDRYGDPRGPGGVGGDPFAGFGDLGDLIESFFGGGFTGGGQRRTRRGGPQAGRDALIDVTLTLEEAAAGVRREVDVSVLRPCDTCQGTGARGDGGPVQCHTCGGAGIMQQVTRSVFGQMLSTTTCPTCRGTGQEVRNACEACRGEGRRQVTETIAVDVPPGVDTGTRLRMVGRGEAGRLGGPAGDLYVRMRIAEHDVFQRDGNDLHCELRVPVTQAALGAELKLTTLHGEQSVRVPPGTQTGEVITLRRQGMPKLNGGGARGDLHVHCWVETPRQLTGEQEDLLRRFAQLRGEDAPPGEYRGLLGRLREVLGG